MPPTVQLYLQESLTFRALTPEAAVVIGRGRPGHIG